MGMSEHEDEVLQRRWVAAQAASRRLEVQCRQLLNALRHADEAWRRACCQLAEFENLTDALEEQMDRRDDMPVRAREPVALPAVHAA
jgi:hypothetical protein